MLPCGYAELVNRFTKRTFAFWSPGVVYHLLLPPPLLPASVVVGAPPVSGDVESDAFELPPPHAVNNNAAPITTPARARLRRE